jgi:hypothetical protein
MMHIVCLGHAKCGTTLLDSVFRKSNLIATPEERKEIKFFLPKLFETEDSHSRYLGKFSTPGGGKDFIGTFEASPPYSHHPPEVLADVLRNVTDTLESPRIVICFRQPVLRAFSHYIHNLHTFALYGEGVFSPRPALVRRPCVMSFEEGLATKPHLAAQYSTTLRLAINAVGRDAVSLFFLERDAVALGPWIARHFGRGVADELAEVTAGSGKVFARRPLPNYLADGSSIHAFGSMLGEYVHYSGLDAPTVEDMLAARERWTLRLSAGDVLRLTESRFRTDLELCADLSGDDWFLRYLEPPSVDEVAVLSSPSLLRELHGVSLHD